MLKNIRPKPASLINWTSSEASQAIENRHMERLHHYTVKLLTEENEKETLSITAINEEDAREQAKVLIQERRIGLKGDLCVFADVFDADKQPDE